MKELPPIPKTTGTLKPFPWRLVGRVLFYSLFLQLLLALFLWIRFGGRRIKGSLGSPNSPMSEIKPRLPGGG